MLFQWLAGNTKQLSCHTVYMKSMCRAIDLIYNACKDIVTKMSLVHDKYGMLHNFDKLCKELPEFDVYLKNKFENKKTGYVEPFKTKAIPLKNLIRELFHPVDKDNQDSTEILEKLAGVGILALSDKLEDEKKATCKYFFISRTRFSFEHCPDVEKNKHAWQDGVR